ncbi:MAG: carcinine hydrolase/isopenicillin-N N-acyltransferase family protein [Bacteroidota bacterium]
MLKTLGICFLFLFLLAAMPSRACSVLYYLDSVTGKIYVANHEDYWYHVEAYLKIMPRSKKEMARLWYGWKDFAQGGVNEAGLFFDGAVTPEQPRPRGSKKVKGNLGDQILARCKTVPEALHFLEKQKIALTNAHIMLGDAKGNAVVLEWVNGERQLVSITGHYLAMTNFLLSDPKIKNHSCPRYSAIQKDIRAMESQRDSIHLLRVGNILAKAAQPPRKNKQGKIGGTLYSTFIDLTKMEFVLIYKLQNERVIQMDLKSEFKKNTKRKILLESL